MLDASVVIAGLVDGRPNGHWSEARLLEGPLVAPHHMPIEVANTLRTAELRGDISSVEAATAVAQLLGLQVELYPFALFADRIWELRANITPADAWYVALAEFLEAPLATLDRRLTRASGPRCEFITPEPEI